MDEERRRRVAERFAMDDLPCGRVEDEAVMGAVEEALESGEHIAPPDPDAVY